MRGWRTAGFTLQIAAGLIVIEALQIAALNHSLPNRLSSILFDNLDFFASYVREAPLDTLKVLLLEKPLFVVSAIHGLNTSQPVFGRQKHSEIKGAEAPFIISTISLHQKHNPAYAFATAGTGFGAAGTRP